MGWATWSPAAAAVEARVLVTDRLTPLRVEGRIVHQVWMPYHWGSDGLVTGDSANDLFGVVARPERVHPGEQGRHLRRPARAAAARARRCWRYVGGYRQRAGITVETGDRRSRPRGRRRQTAPGDRERPEEP